MKAALLTGKQTISLRDIPCPETGNGDVLIRVMCAAVCGTDIRMFSNSENRHDSPLILGHEISGVVELAGEGVRSLHAGDRVAVAPNFGCGICRNCIAGNGHLCTEYNAFGINLPGGFAEYVNIPAEAVRMGNITKIGDNISFEEAALNEPFSCAYNGFERYGVNPGDNCLVIGAGPIGLMHAKLAFMAGAANVIMNDLSGSRLAAAKAVIPGLIICGSDELRQTAADVTKGEGLDVCVIACPSPEAQSASIELMGYFGRVCFFGGLPKSREVVPINTNLVHYKQLVLTGSTRASLSQFRKTLNFIESGIVSVKEMITGKFTIDKIHDAFADAASGVGIKTVISF